MLPGSDLEDWDLLGPPAGVAVRKRDDRVARPAVGDGYHPTGADAEVGIHRDHGRQLLCEPRPHDGEVAGLAIPLSATTHHAGTRNKEQRECEKTNNEI